MAVTSPGGGFVWARIRAGLVAKLDGKAAAWISAHDVSSMWRLPLD